MKCHMTGSASQCSPPPTTGEWVDVTNSGEGWIIRVFLRIFSGGGAKIFFGYKGEGVEGDMYHSA